MKSKIAMAYCTFPDAAIANDICERLVTEGIIACANILPPHQAIYPWQSRVQKGSEVAAWLKFPARKKGLLKERIRGLHPYQIPCLVFVSVEGGLPEYLNWVCAQGI